MTVKEARDKSRLKPVRLVEIALLNSGPTLYFADRNIVLGETRYEDYIAATGCSPSGELILSFKNDRYKNWNFLVEADDTYPFEGAAVTIQELYLSDEGTPSESETLLLGLLGAPEEIDIAGFTCRVSGMEVREDLKW